MLDFVWGILVVVAGIYMIFNQSKQLLATLDPTTTRGKIVAYSVAYGLSVMGIIMLLIIYLDGYCGIHIIKQMIH